MAEQKLKNSRQKTQLTDKVLMVLSEEFQHSTRENESNNNSGNLHSSQLNSSECGMSLASIKLKIRPSTPSRLETVKSSKIYSRKQAALTKNTVEERQMVNNSIDIKEIARENVHAIDSSSLEEATFSSKVFTEINEKFYTTATSGRCDSMIDAHSSSEDCTGEGKSEQSSLIFCSTNRELNTEPPKESSSVYDMVKVSTRKSERTRTSRMSSDVLPIKKSRSDATTGTHSLTSNVTSNVISNVTSNVKSTVTSKGTSIEFNGKSKRNVKTSQEKIVELIRKKCPVNVCYENVLKLITRQALGIHCNMGLKQSVSKLTVSSLKEFNLYKLTTPFNSRCTALDWHPVNCNVLACGAKYGDIKLLDLDTPANDAFIPGRGPGGVQQDLKFIKDNSPTSCVVVTASMDGTVSLRDLRVNSEEILMGEKAFCHPFWPCCVNVSPVGDRVVTGDSKGTVTLLTTTGEKAWSFGLHKKKVNHVEFHTQNEWLLCTASTDKMVCLWDIRHIRDRDSSLQRLVHNEGVASATFSSTDGQRLLTTDQNHELRVYQCGSWALERTFVQPHRHFQHLTPIRASWHPLQDIIIIGRYPDPKITGFTVGERRGVDMFDMTSSTQPVCQLYDSNAYQLISLSKFNISGSVLATTMGTSVLAWKQQYESEDNRDKIVTNSITSKRGPVRRPFSQEKRLSNK